MITKKYHNWEPGESTKSATMGDGWIDGIEEMVADLAQKSAERQGMTVVTASAELRVSIQVLKKTTEAAQPQK